MVVGAREGVLVIGGFVVEGSRGVGLVVLGVLVEFGAVEGGLAFGGEGA